MKNRRGVTRALMGAVFPILNVSALLSVVSGGLHHGQAPQGVPLPYAVLQGPDAYPDLQSMGNPGERVRFLLKACSAAPDYGESLRIIDIAKDLLDGEQPVIPNHHVVRIWWEWTQTYPDPEMVNGVPVWNSVSQWSALMDQVS